MRGPTCLVLMAALAASVPASAQGAGPPAPPTATLSLWLEGFPGQPPPGGVRLRLSAGRSEPSYKVQVELTLPQALRTPEEPDGKRTFTASGQGLTSAGFNLQIPPLPAGTHTFSGVANWGQVEARAEIEVMAPADPQGPSYVLSAGTKAFMCDHLPLKDFAEKVGKLCDRHFEVDPNYASAPITARLSGGGPWWQFLRNTRLTYARQPDGTLTLMPCVGEPPRSPSSGTVNKNQEGQVYLSAYDTDAVALLEQLFEVTGLAWTTPDTLRPTPVRVQTQGAKPFEDALSALCQAAGWKWSRGEGGKYVIEGTK